MVFFFRQRLTVPFGCDYDDAVGECVIVGKDIRGEGLVSLTRGLMYRQSPARGSQSVGCQRFGYDRVDGALLPGNAEGWHAAGRRVAGCTTIANERQALGLTLLLGPVHLAGRVSIIEFLPGIRNCRICPG